LQCRYVGIILSQTLGVLEGSDIIQARPEGWPTNAVRVMTAPGISFQCQAILLCSLSFRLSISPVLQFLLNPSPFLPQVAPTTSCATRYGASKQPCLKPKKSGVRTHQRRMTGMAIQWWTRAPRVSGELLKDSKGKLPSKSISALAK